MSSTVRVALSETPAAADTDIVISEPQSLAMARLFDARDIEFLRALPGYTLRAEAEFRRRRCLIFRGYLRTILAQYLDAISGCGGRYRLRFAAAMIPAYTGLFRYRWDLGRVDLAAVVRRFDTILGEVRQWYPQAG